MGGLFCNPLIFLEHFLCFLVMCACAGHCQGFCVLLSWDVPGGETSTYDGWMEVGRVCMLAREMHDAQDLATRGSMK